ncbi:MAG: 4-hydroxy-tetrahydrodipicolinate reductase [Bacteroidia bacterium]|nr:4-hydroxy-tetrahydrodipicolinate reductase [Bacteroidia bacterium]
MSLRIALVGYGKMGRSVEQEAQIRGHQISLTIDTHNLQEMRSIRPDNSDVIIEFSQPATALENFRTLVPSGVPLVTGTTGWLQHLNEVQELVSQHQGSFLYSMNFSVGVNILFKLNQKLAQMMDQYPEYDPFIEERHHRHKKDAPSGTAHVLAEGVLQNLTRKTRTAGAELTHRAPEADELSVAWARAGEIVGEHTVSYTSEIDRITLKHEAFDRRGFGVGAVIGAEWLFKKQGFYNFADIF